MTATRDLDALDAPRIPPAKLEAILDLQASALHELRRLRDPGLASLIAKLEGQRAGVMRLRDARSAGHIGSGPGSGRSIPTT